jgi:hypothetical protein
MEDIPEMTWEQAKQVALDEITCPLCGGRGGKGLFIPCRGITTGIVMDKAHNCPCGPAGRFWDTFKSVGDRFFDANLATLQPSEKVTTPVARQLELIARIKANPHDNFLFHGPPGGGKTFLAACIYQHTVLTSVTVQIAKNDMIQQVWWTSASVLLNAHVARETNTDAPEPMITERKIRSAIKYGGWKPMVFLDEIDKIAWSEFKIRRLAEIVNVVYELRGQVVATMNTDPAGLAVKWRDANESETVIRRIASDGGHLVHVG